MLCAAQNVQTTYNFHFDNLLLLAQSPVVMIQFHFCYASSHFLFAHC